MSPEVAEKKPYNQAADVYSFGMVLYEILSLNRPKLSRDEDYVDTTSLPICHCWPESIRQILIQSLSHVISERPTMEDIHKVLKSTISHLEVSDISECGVNIVSRAVSNKTRKVEVNSMTA
jgi:serine/threonine protein kinase